MKKNFITWTIILNGLFIIQKANENSNNQLYQQINDKLDEDFEEINNNSHGFFYYLLIFGSIIMGVFLLIISISLLNINHCL
jgi:hypothetical protein